MGIHRSLGVSQKTAWFVLHRLRLVLQERFLLKIGRNDGSDVELTRPSSAAAGKNMHKSRRVTMQNGHGGNRPRQPLSGQNHRAGNPRPRATPCPSHRDSRRPGEALQAQMLKTVNYGSRGYTDDALRRQNQLAYVHEVVNHANDYVSGHVHTNGIENFWSLVKRTLKGTYVAVEPFHLQRYLDEQMFRFNNRATKDNPLTDSDRLSLRSHKSQESDSPTKNSQARQAKRRLSNPYRKRGDGSRRTRFRAALRLPRVRGFLFRQHPIQVGFRYLENTPQSVLKSRVLVGRFWYRLHPLIIPRRFRCIKWGLLRAMCSPRSQTLAVSLILLL